MQPVFSDFQTRAAALWAQLESYLFDHAASWVFALLALVIGSWIVRALDGAVGRLFSRVRLDETLVAFLHKAIRWFLWVLLLVVALGLLGFDVTGFVAGLSAVTFILGFAAKDTLGNLAAGIVILVHKPFRIGDDVEVSGIRGTVLDIDVSACNLRAAEGEFVMVPNSKIWGAPIRNFSRGPKKP